MCHEMQREKELPSLLHAPTSGQEIKRSFSKLAYLLCRVLVNGRLTRVMKYPDLCWSEKEIEQVAEVLKFRVQV